jgi:hypothetical protein
MFGTVSPKIQNSASNLRIILRQILTKQNILVLANTNNTKYIILTNTNTKMKIEKRMIDNKKTHVGLRHSRIAFHDAKSQNSEPSYAELPIVLKTHIPELPFENVYSVTKLSCSGSYLPDSFRQTTMLIV